MPDEQTPTGSGSTDAGATPNANATPDTSGATPASPTPAQSGAADPAKPDGASTTQQPKTPVVPEKYELKLADGVTVDQAIIDKTAETARALGLSQEHAQQTLDFIAKTVTDERAAAVANFQPGGSEYAKQQETWRAAALADPEIGGTTEKLTESVTQAKKVLATFFDPSVNEFLHTTGLGSHPGVIRGLAALGRSMSEGRFIAATGTGTTESDRLNKLYPSMAGAES